MTFLTTLLANWKLALGGVLIAALAGMAGLFYVERDAARADLATAQANLKTAQDRAATLQADNTNLAAQVAQQNAAITQLQADAKARADAAAAAEASAAQAAQSYQKAIAARNAKPVTVGPNACAAAVDMIDTYFKDLQ